MNVEDSSNQEYMNGCIRNDSNNYFLNVYSLYNFIFYIDYFINFYF